MHGGRNYHEPFYDPRNMVVILRRITDVLVELRPEKRGVYEGNYERLKARLDEMIKAYEGALRGYKAIISTAEIQPAVEWLGVKVVAYVVVDQHESPSPGALAKAISEMEEGGVIVFVAVRCDGTCSLASHLDKRLAEEARSRGLTVVEIPLGYTGTSIISKLEYITSQVQQLKGG
jgi:ABC-type Zn uptake system ZnuABC Zn-binding protein ZnuA